jgi:hypothetical protein
MNGPASDNDPSRALRSTSRRMEEMPRPVTIVSPPAPPPPAAPTEERMGVDGGGEVIHIVPRPVSERGQQEPPLLTEESPTVRMETREQLVGNLDERSSNLLPARSTSEFGGSDRAVWTRRVVEQVLEMLDPPPVYRGQ